MADRVRLGPFRLGEQIGEGGMGKVYRAEHIETGVEVAVKVLPRGGTRQARRRFEREVQSQAALVHRGIVYLFEYGRVDASSIDAGESELVVGSPYVAMELADRGTLLEHLPLAGWPALRNVLLQILDALAYAHARQVVHRDLKPENVLVFEGDADTGLDAGPTVKLADFGLAYPVDEEPERDTESLGIPAGTPAYMPPEQAHGSWWRYGPWTDLYALGCITWELVCGRQPFRGENLLELVNKHTNAPRPALEPIMPVPDELEDWVRCAMAIDPSDRFRRAADAARALGRLESVETRVLSPGEQTWRRDGSAMDDTVALDGEERRGEAPTVADVPAPTRMLSTTLDFSPGDSVGGESGGTNDGDGAIPAPTDRSYHMPETWDRTEAPRMPAPLVGTGLGLFGMREVPFVDREAERDAIWEALRRVIEEDEQRLVLLVGERGTGKSQLAEWMGQRAHELGLVDRLRATHTVGEEGRAEGLAGMIRRRFHTWKLSRGDVYEHLRSELPRLSDDDRLCDEDARALTEFLRPTDDDAENVEGPRYRLSSRAQRHALLTRVLQRLGSRRAPMVWLDDLQWGEAAMSLLDYLASAGADDTPALFVGTFRADVLRDSPELSERVAGWSQRESVQRLALDSLDHRDQRQLLERMLPLKDELAEQLTRRTEGNPLFGIQLLGHWVDRNYVVAGPSGFELRDAQMAGIPGDIQSLWRERIDRLAEATGAPSSEFVPLLEWAAALGREIDGDEWRVLCDEADWAAPADLVDRLVERGLAQRTEDGWAFAHGLLVDSLAEQARRAGRWQMHHRRCARLLARIGDVASAGRRADHWEAAGEPERALAPLREQRDRMHESGSLGRERKALERQQRLLDELDVGATDVRRIENTLELAACDVLAGRPVAPIRERIERALERAESIGAVRLVGRARLVIARCAKRQGDFEASRRELDRVLTLVESRDYPELEAKALFGVASIVLESGDLECAEENFETARRKFRVAGNQYWQLQSQLLLNQARVFGGKAREARPQLELILDEAHERGFRLLETIALNIFGELAKFEGEYQQAHDYYRRSARIARELGQKYAEAATHLNLVQIDIARREFERGRQRLGSVTDQLARMGIDEKADLITLTAVALAAGRSDWAEFDQQIRSYEESVPAEGALERDYPWLLEHAGRYALDGGERERARRAWRTARRLWERLDRHRQAGRVARWLGDLNDENLD